MSVNSASDLLYEFREHSATKEIAMTKDAKKKTSTKKKKLTLDKESVKKLNDKELGDVAGGMRAATIQTRNMKCNSDPTACKCP
jgi:hypothetical protein